MEHLTSDPEWVIDQKFNLLMEQRIFIVFSFFFFLFSLGAAFVTKLWHWYWNYEYWLFPLYISLVAATCSTSPSLDVVIQIRILFFPFTWHMNKRWIDIPVVAFVIGSWAQTEFLCFVIWELQIFVFDKKNKTKWLILSRNFR